MNKKARFIPFWIFFAILGVLLIGSFITPFKITLDNIFERIEDNANNNNDSTLSCSSEDSALHVKATCSLLKGFMVIFVLYLLYTWINGMYNGARSPTPVFSPKYKEMQRALED